jgi:hypothetical protein
MKTWFLVFGSIALLSADSLALRVPEHSNAAAVASSDWIFVGRILRVQSYESPIGIEGQQYTIKVERILFGSPPKTAMVLAGISPKPSATGSVFIFYANKHKWPGVDGTLGYHALRPLSERKEIEQLIVERRSKK